MDKKSYIVAIDVGSSKVVVAVGSMAEGGVIEIESIVSEATEGMSAGMVDNSKLVGQALAKAVDCAEQQVGIAITDAYVGISGKFVRCARYTDHVFVEDVENCISLRDLQALRERMSNVKASDGETIMDMFPLTYKGDTGAEMKNPVGCFSKQLSSTYNFILCDHVAKERLRRVFLESGIKIRDMYANAAVVADSVVSIDEKQEGVAVVDIGGGVTDIALYTGGVLRYIASIPIGGSAVTADLINYSLLPEAKAELLKRGYGVAMTEYAPDDEILVRNGGRQPKSYPRLNIAAVIEARMTDIAEYVWNEIRDSGLSRKLAAGIVLTGGGAELKSVDELFRRVTGLDTRVACAEIGVTTESLEKTSSLSSTVAVSLLLRGAAAGACPVGVLRVSPQTQSPTQPQPSAVSNEEPKTVNGQFKNSAGGTSGASDAGGAAGSKAEERVEADTTKQKTNREDDYEDDDDIASNRGGGWFSGMFGKAREAFDKAFKNPDDGDDNEW